MIVFDKLCMVARLDSDRYRTFREFVLLDGPYINQYPSMGRADASDEMLLRFVLSIIMFALI
jgi:hypothetical protein